MTTDELKKEAEEYGIENYESCMYDDTKGWETDRKAREQAYYDGAEPREKRIAELEQQIEKMKSSLNCKHSKENGFCMKGNGYCICDKWELED